jgi:lipopolysaccharide biosynthesis protein
MYLAVLVAMPRRHRNFVSERYDGSDSVINAKRVAVFAHYNRQGLVHDYVIHHLEALKAAGFVIIFVSNSLRLNPESLQAVLASCGLVVCRQNIGYDFGAYKDGLKIIGDLARLDQLILANDSVYGPFHDLADILSKCTDENAVWGITDSWSHRYHLQSYFLLFNKSALSSTAMRRFWDSVMYVQSKDWVIFRYEVGLTQALLRGGLRLEALYAYRQASVALADAVLRRKLLQRDELPSEHLRFLSELFSAIERGVPLNAMHHFWEHLIGEMGCPYIKRDLLTRNPIGAPNVHTWEDLIRRVSSYDTTLISRHLKGEARDKVF